MTDLISFCNCQTWIAYIGDIVDPVTKKPLYEEWLCTECGERHTFAIYLQDEYPDLTEDLYVDYTGKEKRNRLTED